MLLLTEEQVYEHLIMYTIFQIQRNVPEIMYSYIIPNKALHKFITEDMIQAWFDSEKDDVDFIKFACEHISWCRFGGAFVDDMDNYLSCFMVKSFDWKTGEQCFVEFQQEEQEQDFLNWVIEQEYFPETSYEIIKNEWDEEVYKFNEN